MFRSRAKLAVVIINFRTAKLVIDCLESLLPELRGIDAAVIVVDNMSLDNSVELMREWIIGHRAWHFQIIEAAANAGFSAGNNLGMSVVDADYYLLLNSDTVVRPGAISVLLKTADDNRKAGVVSPRLEWPDGTPQESCFRCLSPLSELIGSAQTGPITAALKRFDVPLPVGDSLSQPYWTSFACVLLRGKMVNEIGAMDDGFFMYFEDVEFCRRLHKAGWRVVHNPNARVVHLRGGSSPVKQRTLQRKRLPRYYYAARTRFYYLAYGWLGLTLANVLWSAGRCVSKSREILERRGPGVPDKQWLDIWTNWLNPGIPWARQQQEK
jgi:GT2 family glycosyltransferase